MGILIWIFKFHFKVIYFFLKFFPTNQKKILLISRQSDEIPLDYVLLEQKFHREHPEYKIVIISKTLRKEIISIITYYFSIYKQMFHLATSKACVVNNYIIPVSILKHKKQLLIVQLCHGVGNVKKFAFQTLKMESGKSEKLSKLMNMHRNYDYVISTSKKTSEFYSEAFNVDVSKTLNFGPPKIDYILNIESKQKDVLKRYPNLRKKPVILYVSTFRTYEDNYLEKLIRELPLDKYNVIMHLHPVIYSLHPELDKTINIDGIYRCRDIATVDLLSVADYAITDYSSFMFESAILEMPTYLYVSDYDKYIEKNGLNIDIFEELPGYVFRDAKKLFESIKESKYDKKVIRNFRDRYIENCVGNSTKQLVELLIKGELK